MKLPQLRELYLSKGLLISDSNGITNEGCFALSRGNWPLLEQLYLSRNTEIQTPTKSEMRVASI